MRRDRWVAYLYLMPNLLGFLVFSAFPIAAVFIMALYGGDFLTRFEDGHLSVRATWVGLENFRRLLFEAPVPGEWPVFWRYASNTVFLMAAIPVTMAGSLVLAMLLNRKLPGMVFFRTIYFLPSISAGVALFLIWRWLYNPEVGLINWGLGCVGIQGPNWLSDESWAKPALMLMGFWMAVGGYNMVLYLAALQNVDPALYEAAGLDGAGPWQTFRHITWPQLGPTTFFIFTTNVIGGFQVFDQAYIMTGGGPSGSTTTILYQVYNELYVSSRLGMASAIAVVLFFMILGITLLNWWVGKKVVQYV